jgi:hypothetical protein
MTALITPEQRAQLLANGAAYGTDENFDPLPVVKLFTPDAAYTWLLAHAEPACPEVAWGLCDLGLGYPETGFLYLGEAVIVRGRLGLRVERDLHFTARKPLSAYARDAQRAGMIVTG